MNTYDFLMHESQPLLRLLSPLIRLGFRNLSNILHCVHVVSNTTQGASGWIIMDSCNRETILYTINKRANNLLVPSGIMIVQGQVLAAVGPLLELPMRHLPAPTE